MGENFGGHLFNLLAILSYSKLTLCFESSLRAYISSPAETVLFGNLLEAQSQPVGAGRGLSQH